MLGWVFYISPCNHDWHPLDPRFSNSFNRRLKLSNLKRISPSNVKKVLPRKERHFGNVMTSIISEFSAYSKTREICRSNCTGCSKESLPSDHTGQNRLMFAMTLSASSPYYSANPTFFRCHSYQGDLPMSFSPQASARIIS